MTFEELLVLLTQDNITDTPEHLNNFIEQKFLWNNAFSREMQGIKRYFYALKREILDYTFWQVQKKVKAKGEMTESYFKGLVVNTIREGVRYYSKDVMIGIGGGDNLARLNVSRMVNRNVMEGYVEGVNPFEESEEWEKQHEIDIMLAVLDSLTDPCRTLIHLKYIDELSHKEIVAREVGFTTVESSRVKLAQCLDRMRKFYATKIRDNGKQGINRKIL
jgi:DNA-directed RNA polymerase specialized sigma24 family protein